MYAFDLWRFNVAVDVQSCFFCWIETWMFENICSLVELVDLMIVERISEIWSELILSERNLMNFNVILYEVN